MALDEGENQDGPLGNVRNLRASLGLANGAIELDPAAINSLNDRIMNWRENMAEAMQRAMEAMQRLQERIKSGFPLWLRQKPRRGRPVGTSFDEARAPFLARAIEMIESKVAKGAYAAARMIVEAVGWALTLADAIALGKVPGASDKAAEDALARYIGTHIKKRDAERERASAQRARQTVPQALIAA